jgi:hypothetical protein
MTMRVDYVCARRHNNDFGCRRRSGSLLPPAGDSHDDFPSSQMFNFLFVEEVVLSFSFIHSINHSNSIFLSSSLNNIRPFRRILTLMSFAFSVND